MEKRKKKKKTAPLLRSCMLRLKVEGKEHPKDNRQRQSQEERPRGIQWTRNTPTRK
jgi:hypothetical protein